MRKPPFAAQYGALDHVPCCGLGAQPHAGEVDSDHVVPDLERHLEKWMLFFDAGVVDEDVEAAVRLDRRSDEPLDLVGLRDISGDRDSPGAEALDLFHEFLGWRAGAVIVDDDACALTRERQRNRSTNACVASRDERDLLPQVQMRRLLH